MRPVVALVLLALSGCQATVRPPVISSSPIEEVVPHNHSIRSSPKVTTEPAIPPSNESIESAVGAADKARETVERRRYILDNKSDEKATP